MGEKISRRDIDSGNAFDWGMASADYAKYRDIYPQAFFQKLLDRGLCTKGQAVLDLGTGTGVLPRSLYRYGARFTGTDASESQIAQARRLAAEGHMDIDFQVASAEDSDFPDGSFDVVTACQCHFYFDHRTVTPKVAGMLKPGGRYAILYMAWLPGEDPVAAASEKLVLRYNPLWSGRDETRRPIAPPPGAESFFTVLESIVFDLNVPFTRESWNGRMLACRGIGATLPPEQAAAFSEEHRALLERIAPERFDVKHYAAMTFLEVR